MTALIGFVLFGCITFIGMNIYNSYKTRKIFYDDFILFLQNLDAEIGFFQNKLNQIFDAKIYHKDFQNLIISAQKSIYSLENNLNDWFKNQSIINDEQFFHIKEFFLKLGRLDVTTQKKEIENLKNYLEECILIVKDELNKKGKLSFNLSIMLGLAVFILVL